MPKAAATLVPSTPLAVGANNAMESFGDEVVK
jgi:hypothetical protein